MLNNKFDQPVTNQILAQFWVALKQHTDFTKSLQRGGWNLRKVFVITHNTAWGSRYSLADLSEMVTIKQGDRSFEVVANWADNITVTDLDTVYDEVYALSVD